MPLRMAYRRALYIIHLRVIRKKPVVYAVWTNKRPFQGYPNLVLGAIASFLENLSPKMDIIFKT